MLRKFAIKDESYSRAEECAVLSYEEDTDQYAIEISEAVNPDRLPAIPAILARKGIRSIGDKWARQFVKERVVPAERQNIGQIMRQVGMAYYSEFPLLLYCSGRCCMDDFWLEEITGEQNSAEI
ncbi:MAG: hypothetical protein NC400_11135 [Clostridium sp.]|nr:hypothetical protein [Clostridium sp.]